MAKDGSYIFVAVFNCDSEEDVAKAMQALQVPIVGLMLDGISVTFNRMDGTE
jgi:thioredoxin-like negative regulator of GroEL